MSHKEFRKIQDVLDRKGIFTSIERIKKKEYQCIVSYEIVKIYKTRLSCKNRICKLLNN